MPDCNECKAVPYIVYEAEQARNERTFKRMWVIVLVLIVLLVGSNIAWLAYESQFENVTTSTDTEIDALQFGGGTNIVGGGDINYGTEGQNKD